MRYAAEAELRVAKMYLEQGNSVEAVKENTSSLSADWLINGTDNVEVKRLSSLSSNFAGDLAKGAKQAGSGGTVIIVRPPNASYTVQEAQDFISNFKSPVDNVTFKVVNESDLPTLDAAK